LHYQASMFESSFGDGYHEGETVGIEKGIEIGIEQGIEQTTKTIALKLIQQGATQEIIAAVTELSVTAIEHLTSTEQ
jgi:predicted transposase/invertase (TIGR01784 family)